jgi:hypothetical protein
MAILNNHNESSVSWQCLTSEFRGLFLDRTVDRDNVVATRFEPLLPGSGDLGAPVFQDRVNRSLERAAIMRSNFKQKNGFVRRTGTDLRDNSLNSVASR